MNVKVAGNDKFIGCGCSEGEKKIEVIEEDREWFGMSGQRWRTIDIEDCGHVHECVRERVCVHSRKCSRPHISAALPAHTIFPITLPSEQLAANGEWREEKSSWVSHLECQVGQCGS